MLLKMRAIGINQVNAAVKFAGWQHTGGELPRASDFFEPQMDPDKRAWGIFQEVKMAKNQRHGGSGGVGFEDDFPLKK
jgi:hypothetical protein